MFLRRVIPPLPALLICATTLIGQDNANESERQLSLLVKPTHINLKIIQRELEPGEEKISPRYKEGDNIYFRIQLTNTSVLPAMALVSDPYFQNRPELLRDGEEVAYRHKAGELVQAKDREQFFQRTHFLRLEPHSPKVAGILRLNDWYEPLKPGHYRLINKHRFVPKGEWLESPPITFEIEPKQD